MEGFLGKTPEKTIINAKSLLQPVLAAASLILAFVGQYFLHSRRDVLPGVILFIAAAACLAAAEIIAGRRTGPLATGRQPPNAKLRQDGLPALSVRRQAAGGREIFIFILIIVTAGFFRFYQLDTLPAGAHRDEAKAALDALSLSKGLQPLGASSKIPVYISGITDNPAAYNYIMAVFYKFCPYGITPGRAASAFLGVLAVAAMYFLARGMLGVNFAVIAGFMLAISRWHFTFSRHILHAGFLVFVMILALYFLMKAYAEKKFFYFLAAGFCCGFTLYTFQAGRAFIPVILACLLFMYLKDMDFFRKNREAMLYGAAALAITVVPVAVYMIADPQTFARASYLFIFNSERFFISGFSDITGMLGVYFSAFYKALLMFNMKGSTNFLYNYGYFPMFDFVTGAFFALGFFYSVYRAVIGSKMHAVLLIMLILFLHGTVLFIDCPHATRAIMALPIGILIAAAAAEKAGALLISAGRGIAGGIVFFAAVALLSAAAADNYEAYFKKFKKHNMSWREFSADSRLAGKYIRKLGPGWNPVLDVKYVDLFESYAFYLEAVAFGKMMYETFDPDKHIIRKELMPGKNVFLLGPDYVKDAKRLIEAYPHGLYEPVYEEYNPDRLSFAVFKADSGGKTMLPESSAPGIKAWYYSPASRGRMVSRIEGKVSFYWLAGPPVPAPFTTLLRGRLNVEKGGEYSFRLGTGDACEMRIDGETVFFSAPQEGGFAEGRTEMPAGSRLIEIFVLIDSLPGKVSLSYSGPDTGGEMAEVPGDRLSH